MEHFIILSTLFQINIFKSSIYCFIDGTFKSASKAFYQILVISSIDSQTQLNIPTF